jgi:dihydrofolate reductase
MGKLVVSSFVTVDGVMEDPGGAENFDRGGWAFRFDRGAEGDKFKLDEVMQAEALLLGRVTYQGFAAAWPSRTDEVGFADKMNSMPKYVVSSTLGSADWNNSTLLGGDAAQAATELKQQLDGEVLVNGSGRLVGTLMEHDLIDEYRLMVFPVILGAGKRLFATDIDARALALADTKAVGECLILIYEPAKAEGAPPAQG